MDLNGLHCLLTLARRLEMRGIRLIVYAWRPQPRQLLDLICDLDNLPDGTIRERRGAAAALRRILDFRAYDHHEHGISRTKADSVPSAAIAGLSSRPGTFRSPGWPAGPALRGLEPLALRVPEPNVGRDLDASPHLPAWPEKAWQGGSRVRCSAFGSPTCSVSPVARRVEGHGKAKRTRPVRPAHPAVRCGAAARRPAHRLAACRPWARADGGLSELGVPLFRSFSPSCGRAPPWSAATPAIIRREAGIRPRGCEPGVGGRAVGAAAHCPAESSSRPGAVTG
ncbi:hypothetical protein ACGFX2_33715 [Streptomyces goshikiensis]|uniref:hypothetical protein n=1 Tax=Streptomyces goshikiensis TaxID=1942 RepID=UPI00371F576D